MMYRWSTPFYIQYAIAYMCYYKQTKKTKTAKHEKDNI